MIIAFSLSCSGNILCGVGKDNQSRQVMPPGPVIALSLWPLLCILNSNCQGYFCFLLVPVIHTVKTH